MDLQAIETGGMVVMGLGLIEIIKILITKRANGKKKNESTGECKAIFPDEAKAQLKTLHDLLYRFDDDGSPLCYVPRSWGANQTKMIDLLNKMVNTQENQTKILDRIADK